MVTRNIPTRMGRLAATALVAVGILQLPAITASAAAADCADPMVLVFDGGIAKSASVRLFKSSAGVTIDWGGEGVADPVGTGGSASSQVQTYGASPGTVKFTYDAAAEHTVKVCGSVQSLGSDGAVTPAPALTRISSFGSLGVTSYAYAFASTENLREVPSSLPSTATNLQSMFWVSGKVGSGVSTWDTGNVTNMASMFADTSFNEPIGGWDTSQVTDLSAMFGDASKFNQQLGDWDTSKVITMRRMFAGASSFNQPIGDWNTGSVTDMFGMFANGYDDVAGTPLSDFNQDISGWDTGNVKNMAGMFQRSKFDQPIGNWDTSNLINAAEMFDEAAFNQDLGKWDVRKVELLTGMLKRSGLSVANYDALLNGWAAQKVLTKRSLGATDLKYSGAGKAARARLIKTYKWKITDAGRAKITAATPKLSDTTPTVAQELTAKPGTWSDGATLKYQWYRKSRSGKTKKITGATTDKYTVRAGDAGYRIRVKVTGSMSNYSSVTKYSKWSSKTTKASFSTAPVPTLSTPAQVGAAITATTGTWAPTPDRFTYQWYRVSAKGKSTKIKRATKASYTPKATDEGYRLKLKVRAHKAGYQSASKTSALTSAVTTP